MEGERLDGWELDGYVLGERIEKRETTGFKDSPRKMGLVAGGELGRLEDGSMGKMMAFGGSPR